MMVKPELMSASNAPSASPLKSCETRLGQLIMMGDRGFRRMKSRDTKKADAVGRRCLRRHEVLGSGIVAEVTAEGVRLLHQAVAGDDIDDVVVIFLILHVLLHLAFDDDDGTDA